jgi:hypothetical protein
LNAPRTHSTTTEPAEYNGTDESLIHCKQFSTLVAASQLIYSTSCKSTINFLYFPQNGIFLGGCPETSVTQAGAEAQMQG